MATNQFPYRAIGCDSVAGELELRTARVKQLLDTISRAAGQIGQGLEWALQSVRIEIYVAWLYSEFRWSAIIGDAFAEASSLAELKRSDPESALRIAASLTGNAIAARELAKVVQFRCNAVTNSLPRQLLIQVVGKRITRRNSF